MSFNDVPLLNIMQAKMKYLSARQSVLAQNVANLDTPAYKAKDVAPPDFKAMAFPTKQKLSGGVELATTNSKHIAAAPVNGGGGEVVTRDSTYELKPDGNNVSIEEEMAKIADTQADYNKVLNLYSKTMSMFKIALGRNNA